MATTVNAAGNYGENSYGTDNNELGGLSGTNNFLNGDAEQNESNGGRVGRGWGECKAEMGRFATSPLNTRLMTP